MNKRIKKSVLKSFLFFILAVIAADVILVIQNYLNFNKLNISLGNSSKYEFIIFFTFLIISFYIQLIFHELGHFFAGKFVKFQFCEFYIFPIVIRRKNGRVNLSFSYNNGNMGACFMYPKTFDKINQRWLIYYLGGLIVNFILISISSFCLAISTFSVSCLYIKMGLIIFLVINQINFILNAVPIEMDGIKRDGAHILSILRNSPNDENEITLLNITSQLMAGIRPRDISFEIFNNYKEGCNCQQSELLMNIYCYYYYLDKLNIEKSTYYMDLFEKDIEKYSNIFGVTLECEIFYYYCTLKEDINKAEEIYSVVVKKLNIENDIFTCRIQMAYELYIRKDAKKAFEFGQIGLNLIEDYAIRGMAIFEAG